MMKIAVFALALTVTLPAYAEVMTLPPGIENHWWRSQTDDIDHGWISHVALPPERFESQFLWRDGEKQQYIRRSCIIIDQLIDMFGYSVSCDDGAKTVLYFYGPDSLEFDGTRYDIRREPDELPNEPSQ